MIDTDKYEGHTEGIWIVQSGSVYLADKVTPIARMDRDTNHTTPVERDRNARLIADAPLLLAEVNDLLAEIRQLNNIIGAFDDFMCNNWTPANVHSLWNELLTKEEE
jgi:hypothetical protein